MRFLVLATLSGLALMGCASVQQAPNTQETIRYASSPCFGACPIYSVEVAPTGLIRFEGKQYTKAIGVKEIQGSIKDYQKLVSDLKTYRPETGTQAKTGGCQQTATDMSSYYISWIQANGTETKLSHYKGCMSPANNKLNKIMDSLPEQLGIKDLI
ncbi:hypothetical protein MWMV7_MWMV7_00756 [Acinetobacter calcoaceticus]|uniref:DUF6438 domain-containing protein n=1 Tax=Acinetobacter oleivorans TaxID=1148157 RepID=A0A0B2UEI8_9GAMM|nr:MULTISPECIES: DUF6438 domain-containing protein [Acinetobacter]KHN67310.1 hypothetical protein DH17_11470 [Acinetobacter oleivorans]KUM11303.1 hypothetical protein AV645_06405 [Acinetobacter calcoaceticus]MCU4423500.1 hypothetical protein [Acinetobacter sp. WU_MDCI_Abxb74]CAI3112828.1 hypothetical protein MWMV7_MWMV7_00756 [Acinetobacter calcoaceticus]